MAVFEFTLTGRIEVDADTVGIAAANMIKTQPGPGGEIDVDYGRQFRMDPERAMGLLVEQGFYRIVQERLHGWTIHKAAGSAQMVTD